MRQKSGPEKQPAEDVIRDIRRATRRHFSRLERENIKRQTIAHRRLQHQLQAAYPRPPMSQNLPS
jgi:hypothetical protein